MSTLETIVNIVASIGCVELYRREMIRRDASRHRYRVTPAMYIASQTV